MRPLDLIVQGRCPSVCADDRTELPTALRFTEVVRACPLRLVLADELVRCATQLAFAEGNRLSACLDLIRVPAQCLWVEWADVPRQKALMAIPSLGRGETYLTMEGEPAIEELLEHLRLHFFLEHIEVSAPLDRSLMRGHETSAGQCASGSSAQSNRDAHLGITPGRPFDYGALGGVRLIKMVPICAIE
jgi:hypothetical protein